MAAPRAFREVSTKFLEFESDISIASPGSSIFVANSDAKTAQADPLDPWAVVAGDDAEGATVVRIPVGAASYLDLYHAWSVPDAASVEDPTTAPVVRVYGRTKESGKVTSGERLYPFDIDADNWPSLDEFWKPLVDPSPPSGAANNYEIELGNTPNYHYNVPPVIPSGSGSASGSGSGSGSPSSPEDRVFRVSELRKVQIVGCEEIIVVIETAAAGHDGESMILGQLIR